MMTLMMILQLVNPMTGDWVAVKVHASEAKGKHKLDRLSKRKSARQADPVMHIARIEGIEDEGSPYQVSFLKRTGDSSYVLAEVEDKKFH